MKDAGIAAARGRLIALKARFDAGKIDAARYDADRLRIERELGDALLAGAGPSPSASASAEAADKDTAAARPSARLVTVLAVAVIGVAVAGYAMTGSPSLAGLGPAAKPGLAAAEDATSRADPTAPPDPAASDARQVGLKQIAAMVDGLAARMKDRPDDAEGWIMLARSYTVLGRFSDALPAYRRATELQPKNPSLLADYADAIGATQGSIGNPESVALIERALAADPKHPKALALAGTVAYDRGDFTGAIARWQTLADVLPPDNELLKQVQASIAEAREHAGASTAGALPAPGPAATMATRPVAASPDSVSPATTGAAGASTAATSVSGSVALAPALAGRAAPGDTIFVFARAAEGGRMPLAVQRARVADLPLSFKLDDSMAMAPNAKLSGARSVIVSARISKSGNAMPQAGDLSGESAPVTPGTSGIEIRIDTVVGARQ